MLHQTAALAAKRKLASDQVVAKLKTLTQKQKTENSFLQSKTDGSPLQQTHFKRCSFSFQGKCSAFPVCIFADQLVSPMLTLVTKAILPYSSLNQWWYHIDSWDISSIVKSSISSAIANHKIAFFNVNVQIAVSFFDFDSCWVNACTEGCCAKYSPTKDQLQSKWVRGWRFCHH